jgi:hypothetical protein
MRVVVCNPDVQRTDNGQRMDPLLQPEAFFCECPHDSLGIRVAFGIVIAGEGLQNPQGAAGLREGQRGWLAAVVTHQGQALVSSSLGKPAAYRHVQRCQAMPSGPRHTSVIPADLFRVPIQHQHDRDPTEAVYPDLGHIVAPPLMRCGRPKCAPTRRPLGFALWVGLH